MQTFSIKSRKNLINKTRFKLLEYIQNFKKFKQIYFIKTKKVIKANSLKNKI